VITARDAVGQRSETVRRANLSAIATELHLHGPLSRSELVARTGLTRSAIRGLIGEFVAAGLASEERSATAGIPGRPSPLVQPNPGRAVVLALDIAVDSLGAALVGFGGDVLERRRVDRPRGHLAVDQIVGDLTELAIPVLRRVSHPDALVAVSVGVVGVVRRGDGQVRVAPNLSWHNVPLAALLTGALGVGVDVSVANEADLGALAEHRRGAAVGVDDVVYISGEVGVGGGIITGGRPLDGSEGYAGEVGHMPVNVEGGPCRCGSIGCWETEIGEHALLTRAGRSPSGGRAGVDAILASAGQGSSRELDALAEVGRWLGIGLAGLVNVFNPQMVVLGGLFGRMHPFVEQTVHAVLERRALEAAREHVEVVPAVLGGDAPLLGAAEHGFESLLRDPAAWFGRQRAPIEAATA
jgi:predicted NBD/HSP70 family sugar kinase